MLSIGMGHQVQNTCLFLYSLSKASAWLSKDFKNLSLVVSSPLLSPSSLSGGRSHVCLEHMEWWSFKGSLLKGQELVVPCLESFTYEQACQMGQGPVLYSLIAICWWVSILENGDPLEDWCTQGAGSTDAWPWTQLRTTLWTQWWGKRAMWWWWWQPL